MAKPYRAVLFDQDGTLLDTETLSFKAWEGVADRCGVRVPDDVILSFTGSPAARVLATIREALPGQLDGPGQPTGEELMALHAQVWREMRVSGPVPLKGDDLPGMLAALSARGIKLAVGSSSPREAVEENLGRADILKHFDALVCGAEIEHGKPAPDIYLKAAEKLGCAPEECLVVEDAPNGIRSGLAAGMDVAVIPDLVAVPQDLACQCIMLEKIDQVADLIA